MTNAILRGKPDAGNPHVRFDEGEVASAKPRRGSLLYKKTFWAIACAGALFAFGQNEALSPFDDVTYWFRGGVDSSGNGILDSGSYEFRDVSHASDASHAHHRMTLSQADAANYDLLEACVGKVVLPYAGRRLDNAPYLHLPQRFVTNGVFTSETGVEYAYGTLHANYINLPKFLSDFPSGVDCTNYTVFVRFRDESKVSEKEPEHCLFQVGYSWASNSGISLNLNDSGVAGSVIPRLYIGSSIQSVNDESFRIPYGRWCDLAVRVEGTNVTFGICQNVNDEGTLTNRLYAFKTLAASEGKSTAIRSGQRWGRLGGESSGITGVYTNNYSYKVPKSDKMVDGGTHDDPSMENKAKAFRGDIQTFAFWTRALSTNEILQVFSERRPAIVQVGLANGTNTEFTGAEGTGDASGLHPENWNPVLNAARPSASVEFTVVDGEEGVSQYLRIRPVPTSVAATVKVELDGTELSTKTMGPDRDTLIYIPAAKMTQGTHALKFTRTDSMAGDFAIDAFRIYGSWRIGNSKNYGGMVHESIHPYQYNSPRRFPVTDGNMDHFARGFSGPVTDDNSTHIIPFEIPGSWVGRMQDATFSFFLNEGSVQDFEILLNGVSVQTIASAATGKEHIVTIPASGFIAGENVLTIRKTTANGGTWINCGRYMFSLGKMNDGMKIILR